MAKVQSKRVGHTVVFEKFFENFFRITELEETSEDIVMRSGIVRIIEIID